MTRRGGWWIVLGAWALGSVSCGLIRLPFRVAGGVARGTIHAGETVYQKSKEGLGRDKKEEPDKSGKPGADEKRPPAQAPPQNGGLLPDLPPEPDSATPAPSGGGNSAPPPSDGAGYSEPPLPELSD